ncbi:ribonuclease HII [Candidatus Dependentiae bacterium]|jgi:ribonuclease HII|nr:ribonuclease HII [Candidatus Dependentiae bacterium]
MKRKNISFPLNYFEKKAWNDQLYVCGIDEVGRGCLAGPVVVAAVIIPLNKSYHLLKDSKLMSHDERELAYKWITKHCTYSIAIACHKTVDQHNIYQTTLRTMKKAYISLIEKLPFAFKQLKYVVVDAMPLVIEKSYTHTDLEVHHFNYGESISHSIAAASIIAKVTRDRLLEKIDCLFPAYSFGKHKGYATKVHIQALEQHGPSLLHRISFLSNFGKKESDDNHQQSLF